MLAQWLCLAAFLAATVLLTRLLRPATVIAAVCTAFVAMTALVVLAGHALSAAGLLGATGAWSAAGVAATAIMGAVAFRLGGPAARPDYGAAIRNAVLAIRQDWGLAIMAATVMIAGILNFVVVVRTAPGGWDALSYHLPKMAFAIQRGSFDLDVVNYWAQQVHPTNGTALLIFAFLSAGGTDHLLSLWQYASYWIAMAAVGGITRECGGTARQALWATLTFGLLTNALVQSIDAGNDLILTAFIATAAYMMLLSARTSDVRPLWVAGTALGLALGTKALALIAVPSLALWAIAACGRTGGRFRPRFIVHATAAMCAGVLTFSMPAGFVGNAVKWGDPFLGPAEVTRGITFDGAPMSDRLAHGSRNLARYVADSLSADGLPRLGMIQRGHDLMRRPLRWLGEATALGLEDPAGTRAPFTYDRLMSAHEAHSFWGILGLLSLWPAMVLGAVHGRDWRRVCAIAALLFFPAQSYVVRYDPWHGRFFLMAAVFAAPAAGLWLGLMPIRRYARVTAIAGCAAALSAVLLRSNGPLIAVHYGGVVRPSVLSLDRVRQLTRNNPAMDAPLRAYEAAVPRDASVGACLPPGSFEYALWGDGLTRRVVPVPMGHRPAAATEWYLFDLSCGAPREGDVELGSGWWLRHGPPG